MANKPKTSQEELKSKAETFKQELNAFKHKDTSEYTRLVHALEEFIKFGAWESEEGT
jgi:hypothetical protein